jgi:hypothetical protein
MSLVIAQIKRTLNVGLRSLTFTRIYLISQFNPTLISPDVISPTVHFTTDATSSFLPRAVSHTHTLSVSLRYLALFPSISV